MSITRLFGGEELLALRDGILGSPRPVSSDVEWDLGLEQASDDEVA
jgi:hypothetical protein